MLALLRESSRSRGPHGRTHHKTGNASKLLRRKFIWWNFSQLLQLFAFAKQQIAKLLSRQSSVDVITVHCIRFLFIDKFPCKLTSIGLCVCVFVCLLTNSCGLICVVPPQLCNYKIFMLTYYLLPVKSQPYLGADGPTGAQLLFSPVLALWWAWLEFFSCFFRPVTKSVFWVVVLR